MKMGLRRKTISSLLLAATTLVSSCSIDSSSALAGEASQAAEASYELQGAWYAPLGEDGIDSADGALSLADAPHYTGGASRVSAVPVGGFVSLVNSIPACTKFVSPAPYYSCDLLNSSGGRAFDDSVARSLEGKACACAVRLGCNASKGPAYVTYQGKTYKLSVSPFKTEVFHPSMGTISRTFDRTGLVCSSTPVSIRCVDTK